MEAEGGLAAKNEAKESSALASLEQESEIKDVEAPAGKPLAQEQPASKKKKKKGAKANQKN